MEYHKMTQDGVDSEVTYRLTTEQVLILLGDEKFADTCQKLSIKKKASDLWSVKLLIMDAPLLEELLKD